MGFGVAAVVLGYLAACGLILLIAAFVVGFSKPKRLVITEAALIFVMAWPIWFYYGNKGFFVLACAIGSPGTKIYQPFKIEAFTFDYGGHKGIGGHWRAGPEFISKCNWKCNEELAGAHGPFSYYRPWSVVREGDVAIETTWALLPGNGKRAVRLWVAPIGSAHCLTPLREGDKPASKCIAGHEIEKITASFVASPWPFVRRPHPLDPEGPSSLEWSWFGVEKHQNHLLKDDKLVARYVWYEKRFFSPIFFPIESCPFTPPSGYAADGQRMFWKTVLDRNGVKPDAR